ncbi:hypothetical protein BSR29_02185 [Boudabousia liubingyangii]|uniref:General stress protein 17M-like domain-containing protein n=1 Tax=Boudabousia liubingyangii TaxID=1921764 RepID=A0A1Q5PQ83_9ACTO|nr:general stress protein [Boudabousia liubingyangii]OKL49778.1 hypothetical protein BSR29_02185 [Boudabousia liubingyangii]
MSINNFSFKSGPQPTGRTVANFETSEQAHEALRKLSEAGFNQDQIATVGTDLKLIEQVTGKVTFARILFSGLMQGLWFGVMIGLMYFVVSEHATWQAASMAASIGLVGGLVLGLTAYFMRPDLRGKVTTQSHVVASSYDILVKAESDRARELLKDMPGNRMRVVQRPPRADDPSKRPPRYGVRLDEEELDALREQDGVYLPENQAASSSDSQGSDTTSADSTDNDQEDRGPFDLKPGEDPFKNIPSRRSRR